MKTFRTILVFNKNKPLNEADAFDIRDEIQVVLKDLGYVDATVEFLYLPPPGSDVWTNDATTAM